MTVGALAERGYFADAGPHKIIICGDLLDRGDKCRQVIDFVAGLLDKGEVILIRGNHEDLLEDFVYNMRAYAEDNLRADNHNNNGTIKTVTDLTGATKEQLITSPGAIAAAMRQSAMFRKILPAMKDYYETRNYIFVHGWIPSTVIKRGNEERYLYNAGWRDASAKEWEDARWYNGMLAAHQGAAEPGKTIVCGHCTASFGHSAFEGKGSEFGADADFSPYYGGGVICLDASTANSGKANCIVIEDEEKD